MTVRIHERDMSTWADISSLMRPRCCHGCCARPSLPSPPPSRSFPRSARSLAPLSLLAGVLRGARFCEYSGKWYCRQCHLNQRSVVPARILQAWDFGQYRVSVRAKDFIETIWDEAVFDVEVFNDALYSKVKALAEMRVRVRRAMAMSPT